MIHGKCDKCETCVNQADLISSAEEAICPDCIKGSHYVESYISGLKRQIAELKKDLKGYIECSEDLIKKYNGDGLEVIRLKKQIELMKSDCQPSGETKGIHNGEYIFSLDLNGWDEDGEHVEYSQDVTVPWTTVKEIMKRISKNWEPSP